MNQYNHGRHKSNGDAMRRNGAIEPKTTTQTAAVAHTRAKAHLWVRQRPKTVMSAIGTRKMTCGVGKAVNVMITAMISRAAEIRDLRGAISRDLKRIWAK